ncbi:MAG TPA: LLM class flavin-dependent oxidoreductase [Candidatus Limnocylindria bacterium]|nr:LLM class flavin-dependent oxidoreductase [Candidatus Limnocylindria bacterium]
MDPRPGPPQMTLVAFLQAQNCSNYPASWRHAATTPDFMTAEYYQRIARTLEDGKFHMAFFDDRLAMPDRYGDDYRESVRHGIRVVKLDPIPLLTAMGMATRRLGLGATYSTTYHEPFHVARVFATLDHLVGGRAAWNVVTSLNDSEAANFGQAAHPAHDLRYDRADEFMEAVLGHWDTWEDDAIVLDGAHGVFADPDKVHRLDHRGTWFRSRGPFTVPRTPQGRPVIIQAGQSGRGRTFAARWGELVFTIFPSRDFAVKAYRDVKDAVVGVGRDPRAVHVTPAVYCIVGETPGAAEDKAAYIDGLAHPLDALVLLSEVLNFDFASRKIDEPLSDEDLASITGLQAVRDRVTRLSGKTNPAPRDFVEHSGRGTLRELPCFVGTASAVADGLEEWFTSGACDGFVLAATHMPGAYEDFVRLVVPELQRRGLYHRDYAGPTLRDNLGLPCAARGDWKRKAS